MPTLEEEISRRRTFAIISHPDAGKTTLTEKFLLYGGAIAQAGEVKGKRARAATSDWMEIEKQRGISVTSSVMQFQHNGFCINILDTPGHQDFSEDTYRTLMAADSAVMVIDGAKGVEPQTRKLFKVCALRHIPIFTFINKMDRETRDPLELCEEVERELGIDTYAVNWPIGCGKEFAGVYDREKQRILFFSGETKGKKVNSVEVALEDPSLDEMLGVEKAAKLRDEVELLGAGRDFDMQAVRNGTLSPVFFGSALTTFGVEPFLEEFLRMTTAPLPRVSDQGEVDVFSPDRGFRTLGREDVRCEYRFFGLKDGGKPWFAISSIVLALRPAEPEAIRTALRDNIKRKLRVQPVRSWSAGCVFKNPPEGTSAGKLLDEAGFRGKRLGGICFSEIHANFLVNEGKGSADAALELIRSAQSAVWERFGIQLQTEVKLWVF